MKNFKIKIKEFLRNAKDSLIKNSYSVITGLVVLSLCLIWSFSREVKHAAESLRLHTNQAVILQNLKDYKRLNSDQTEYIKVQEMVIKNQQQQMKKADEYIKMQKDAIEKLIKFLKDIDEWPPQQRYDPDKIT